MEQDFANETTEFSHEEIMEFYNETVLFERRIGIIIPTIFAVIIVVGTVGNVLVVIVALNRQMRNSTNTLIIGLAVSDLMFLLLCVPFTAIDYAASVWIFPEWMCSMINFFQHTSAYASVWTLTLMALDRFLAVVYPVNSMTLRTPRNTLIAMIVVYSIIIATQVPVGLMHGIYTYDFIIEERSVCAVVSIATNNATQSEARTYFITFNVFGYILPLGISVCLYWKMLNRLWVTPRPGHSGGSMRGRPDARRAKRKVTRLVSSVLIIWAFCWLPLNVCFFMSGISYPETLVMKYGLKMVLIQITSQVLAYTNSCLNPILYALMSENFRKGFLRIIHRICNKVTCGYCCDDEDKQGFRLELTNANNVTNQSSMRQSLHSPRVPVGEKSFLLRSQDERGSRKYLDLPQSPKTRQGSSDSFNL